MKNQILDYLKIHQQATLKEIEKACKPRTSKDFTNMIRSLNEMEEEKLIFNDHHIYQYIDPSCMFIGSVKDISRFEFLVNCADCKIRVDKRNSRNVFEKDEVLVLEKEKQNKIIHVFSHGIKKITGTFYRRRNELIFYSDVDFHRPIIIRNKKDFKIEHRTKAVLDIIKYKDPLETKISAVLGKEHEKGVDIDAMLYENNVRINFNEHIKKEVKKLDQVVTEKDRMNRVDYRMLKTVTIDGDDARDFDDAISIEEDEQGYILYVHIADVSHYVKKNSAIDKEAYLRSTSIYLADRVVPMLPFELSNGICSLNPNVDRCTLTCKMHIDTAGKCTSYTIVPSLIHSDQRCTYAKVNALLENDPSVLAEYDKVKDLLLRLEKCARSLQEKSMERGCIDFNSKEAKIILNKNGKPVDVQLKSRGFAEQMIEECMILANVCVANYLHSHSLPCMYRVHEDPDPKKVYSLCSIADILHEEINFDPEHIQAKDIQLLLEQVKNPANKEILSIVALRTMQKARYDEKCIGHYGLALSEYCHFTSPIRRYSDLIVHRMLRKYCFEECKKDPRYDMEIIQEQSLHVSSKERDAIAIERKVDDYEKALYMSSRIGKRFKGTIVGVQSFGFFVELENTIEGLVPIRSLYDDFYEFDEDTMSLQAQMTGNRYQIGQSVNVVCMETDINKGQITFALC